MSTTDSPLPNRFRQRLRAGERLIGCWASLSSPISTEVLGTAGFDWLLIDGEHSPNDLQTFIAQLMALKDSVSAPVCRPESLNPVLMKRLLDIGFYNFLIPFIESREQAQLAVAATRYPPAGIRGVSLAQRSNRYGTVPGYLETINDNICLILQIESRAGVAAVDDIASVDGVDAVFIGPADLSAAYGHLGNPGHPEVQQVIRHITERVRAHGKAVSILTPIRADAQRYIEMGIQVVAVGSDLNLLRDSARGLREAFAPTGIRR
jgi:2-dehydro-3-deoxyglucarate aldolase